MDRCTFLCLFLLISDMFFDRSILVKELCPIIALFPSIHSFSFNKDERSDALDMNMDMPGRMEMKLTMQGLRVSLEMYKVKRTQIRTYFDSDTFFIEGKTKRRHYITGIHLPKEIRKKHKMIRRLMKGRNFFAFIPCYAKKEIKIKYYPF